MRHKELNDEWIYKVDTYIIKYKRKIKKIEDVEKVSFMKLKEVKERNVIF